MFSYYPTYKRFYCKYHISCDWYAHNNEFYNCGIVFINHIMDFYCCDCLSSLSEYDELRKPARPIIHGYYIVVWEICSGSWEGLGVRRSTSGFPPGILGSWTFTINAIVPQLQLTRKCIFILHFTFHFNSVFLHISKLSFLFQEMSYSQVLIQSLEKSYFIHWYCQFCQI